jgi:hypothetical protein
MSYEHGAPAPTSGRHRSCYPGLTEAIMLAHGFPLDLLAGLIRAGLAVAQPEIVKAGGRVIGVVRIAITDVGRAALGG